MVQSESTLLRLRSHFTIYGERFFTSTWSHDLPRDLIVLLQSFQKVISYFEDTRNSDVQSFPELTNYLVYLSYHLRSVLHNCSLNSLQTSLVFSVSIYTLVRIWTFEGCPGLESIHQIFRESLEPIIPVLEASAPDLIFWMYFVSLLALRALPSRSWYVERIRMLAYRMKLQNWEDAKHILEGFFFVERGISDPARRIWQEVSESSADTMSAGGSKSWT